MKIVLKAATFYFGGPVALSPAKREESVNLKDLDDSTVRRLGLGVKTGVIEIAEGSDEFEAKLKELDEAKKPKEETEEVKSVVEVVEEKIEEVKVEKVEEAKPAEVKEEAPKKTTTTRKTTTKK